jgi:hypothetical protein
MKLMHGKSLRSLAAFALVTACLWVPGGALAQAYPPAVSQLVAAAKAQIKTIDMATFKAALDKSSVGLLIANLTSTQADSFPAPSTCHAA